MTVFERLVVDKTHLIAWQRGVESLVHTVSEFAGCRAEGNTGITGLLEVTIRSAYTVQQQKRAFGVVRLELMRIDTHFLETTSVT